MSEKVLRVEVVLNEKNKEVIWDLLNFSLDRDCFFVFDVDPEDERSTQESEKPVLSRSEISKLTKKAMDKNKKELRAFTGPIYGWDKLKDGSLKPNWKEQKQIDCMRFLYLSQKLSANKIAKVLTNSKVKGKRGGKWTSVGVMRVINNDFHKNRSRFPMPAKWRENPYPEMTWGKKPKVVD